MNPLPTRRHASSGETNPRNGTENGHAERGAAHDGASARSNVAVEPSCPRCTFLRGACLEHRLVQAEQEAERLRNQVAHLEARIIALGGVLQ